jgi:hypothetical protein
MIVVREILNVKQTQIHPRHPSQGWRRRLSSKALLATWPNSRLSGQVTLGSTVAFTHRQTQTTRPCSSKTKLFRIEFSDLHVSKDDSIKPWCDQLECQLFEAEYLADEDSIFVQADVAAIVYPSQKETLRVRELRQLAR